MKELNILWADDQADVSRTFSSLLEAINASITHAKSGMEALEILHSRPFDLLILDLKMPPGVWGGLWLLDKLKEERSMVLTLVLSGEGTQVETIKAIRSGAYDYVTKDRADAELLPRILELIANEGPDKQLLRLLEIGENSTLECKETIRWNVNAGKVDKIPEFAVVKTISAFVNTQGGVLIVGANDKMEIVGVEKDRFDHNDAMLLHLDNIVKAYIGDGCSPLIQARFVTVQNKTALRIDCRAGTIPVYTKSAAGTDVEFYIRRQASSVRLRLDEVVTYIRERFPMEAHASK